jgi:hypothetical protein
MWIRSAYWIGEAIDGDVAAVKQFVRGTLLPELASLPRVQSAQVFWPEGREPGAPNLLCQIALSFHSREDIDVMLASPQREDMRRRAFASLKAIFNGTIAHLDLEVFSAK